MNYYIDFMNFKIKYIIYYKVNTSGLTKERKETLNELQLKIFLKQLNKDTKIKLISYLYVENKYTELLDSVNYQGKTYDYFKESRILGEINYLKLHSN